MGRGSLYTGGLGAAPGTGTKGEGGEEGCNI